MSKCCVHSLVVLSWHGGHYALVCDFLSRDVNTACASSYFSFSFSTEYLFNSLVIYEDLLEQSSVKNGASCNMFCQVSSIIYEQ